MVFTEIDCLVTSKESNWPNILLSLDCYYSAQCSRGLRLARDDNPEPDCAYEALIRTSGLSSIGSG